MHYLIDGHNLIGKLPDIKLSDPDDEIRLILRLQGWVKGGQQRQVTVVFDGGTMGGVSHRLSTKEITVVFAPSDKTADDLLIRRLKRLRSPRHFTLISSDRRIIDAARLARIKFLKSEEFMERLGFSFTKPVQKEKPPPPTPEPPEKEEDPQLSAAEVDQWLQLFGPPQTAASGKRRGSYSVIRREGTPGEPEPEPEPEPKRALTPAEFAAMAESDNPELDDEEIAAWLDLFGPVPQKRQSSPSQSSIQSKKEEEPSKTRRLSTMKDARRKLTEEEVDDWLQLFGGEKE